MKAEIIMWSRESALSLSTAGMGHEVPAETFAMDEESFRVFYEMTARPLWAYLSRASGEPAAADDLLQESYFRLLRASPPELSLQERRRYLFRIATNLLRDRWRRERKELPRGAHPAEASRPGPGGDTEVRAALSRLKPRERQLLWLAYVEENDHREIARITGLKPGSIRMLLFRARQRLAATLHGRHELAVASLGVKQ